MRPIELYGANTGNCLRVSIALEEIQTPYVVCVLDLKAGEQRAAGHLALNPAGKVPTIVVWSSDGQPNAISQSNAILFHLADRNQNALLPPPGAPERVVALQRFFFFLTDVIGPSHGAFNLRQGGHEDPAVWLDERALAALLTAERFLQKETFMSGPAFGLADIAAFTIMLAYRRQIRWSGTPGLKHWYEAVAQRPGVIRGLQAFGTG